MDTNTPSNVTLLSIERLRIELPERSGHRTVVRNLGVKMAAGETVGLVGPSGSGKTMTALAVLGLLPRDARVGGRILLGGQDLVGLPERRLREIRGRRIATIFQEPRAALNPVRPIGRQIGEVLRVRGGMTRAQARQRRVELLDAVGIERAAARQSSYPHELSGGEAQRVMIAMALAVAPDLLIADEPTTALDAETGRRVMDLLVELKQRHGFGLMLISHDNALVSRLADQVVDMDRGRRTDASATPRSHYPEAERAARSRLRETDSGVPVLSINNLSVRFGTPRRGVSAGTPPAAVDGVSLELAANEILALVGPSGSGKTTLARSILGLNTPAGGKIWFLGRPQPTSRRGARRRGRSGIQMVFQDPYTTLNPRRTVAQALTEALACGKRPAGVAAVLALLGKVELSPQLIDRYPHELSGGERQRVAIARALAEGPRLLLLDEPMSALDYPVRIKLLQLFERLRGSEGLSMLLISHDLLLVEAWADRIVVMRGGRLVDERPGTAAR